MAGKDRNQNADIALLQAMGDEPYRFGFFEAMRQIECMHRDAPRLGKSLRPADDPVRLGQRPSLRFASSTLASFQQRQEAPLLQVYFMGLLGPNGPLPLHLTEYIRQRKLNARDPVPAEFLDMFHHRLLSLFYRAWADKEPTVHFDRPEDDRFAFYVGALCGLAPPALRRRDAMPDAAKLHFSAYLGGHTKHAHGLASMLQNYFHITVKIRELVGEWLDIPTESYCYLDDDEDTGQLGVSAVCGTRSWQCQHKFTVQLGPIDFKDYQRMLPSGNKLRILRDVVRNYIGLEFTWDLNLVLEKQQVPPARLGEQVRLGWTSWLPTEKRNNDANELYLLVENYAAELRSL